jgi:two-component system CitB family sensor kinase
VARRSWLSRLTPRSALRRRDRRMPFTRQMLLLQIGVLALVVGLGFALVAWQLDRTLKREYERHALAVARTVAVDPLLARDVVARDQPAVQSIADRAQQATDALFVVVTDVHGIRLAHPNPAEIGKKVSTSPDAALSGHEVANIERGTLGLSARGKVPLRTADGTIVGEVSVGFDANDISSALLQLLARTALFSGGALLLGVAGSALLARLLKRRTFGLEPADLAELVREREAVLYAVSDGVVAVDVDGRVTMANSEAQRLLDDTVQRGRLLSELDLPPRLHAVVAAPGEAVAVSGNRVLVVKHRSVERDGKPLGSVLTLLDRTEIEQLTDELHAVRLMTEALRAQRHEFANRLHTVHGLLQTAGLEDASEYLAALIGAPELGRLGDDDAVASATIRAFLAGKAAEAAEVGVRLSLSDTSWLPHKLVAPVEVITVLGNLVNNAIEAASGSTRRPAEVVVDLLADGTDLVLSVSNTGDGLAPDRVEAIFVEGVSSRGPGRGLGLPITQQTAAALGGDVRVTNVGGNGWTVLSARLPGVLAVRSPKEAEA